MKKAIRSIFIMLLVIAGISMTEVPQAQAYQYDNYLNGDTNYPLLYGHMGSAWYLDKSSVVVKQDDSVAHKFAENIIMVDADNGYSIINTGTLWFYQKLQRDDFFEAYTGNGEKWRSFEVNSSYGADQVVVNAFKLGWKAAFRCSWP